MYSVSTIPKRKSSTTLSISNFDINHSDLEYHYQPIPFYDNYVKSSAHTDFTHNWVLLSSSISSSLDDLSTFPITPFIVLIALTIGILANGWISRLISGDQGLGSYLSDGSGYNKSKFKLLQPTKDNADRAVQDDPLPWLRLPNLDYVEVAGQKNERTNNRPNMVGLDITNDNNNRDDSTIALDELELLRLRMQEQLLLGNINEAERLRKELERIMKDNNIQFTKES